MSFTASALVLAWVAIVLLALGLAGLLRQVSLLTRQIEAGTGHDGVPGGGPALGAAGLGARGARTTRELVGFRVPAEVIDRVRSDGVRHTVVAFVSPGCSSCSATLRGLAEDPGITAGSIGLTVVSTGSCEPALADTAALPPGRVTCLPQGRDLMHRLAVPATPYLTLLDAHGTLVAALLPDEDTDLAAWVRSTQGSLTITEERA